MKWIDFPRNSGLYEIIYVDPPWKYNDKLKLSGDKISRGGAESHYSCLTPADIKALPVQSISTKDSVLLLWSTYPQLPVAISVLDAWGFKYITVLWTWIKLTKTGKVFMGMGHYSRANPEIVLLGKRGKGVSVRRHNIKNVQFHTRLSHSEKPDLFRELSFELFAPSRGIELFARKDVGVPWDCWGEELGSKLYIPGEQNGRTNQF